MSLKVLKTWDWWPEEGSQWCTLKCFLHVPPQTSCLGKRSKSSLPLAWGETVDATPVYDNISAKATLKWTHCSKTHRRQQISLSRTLLGAGYEQLSSHKWVVKKQEEECILLGIRPTTSNFTKMCLKIITVRAWLVQPFCIWQKRCTESFGHSRQQIATWFCKTLQNEPGNGPFVKVNGHWVRTNPLWWCSAALRGFSVGRKMPLT